VTIEDMGGGACREGRPVNRIRLRTPARDYGEIEIGLAGAHQVDNAVVAVRLIEAIEARGTPVGADAIREGLAGVRWPGRLDHRRLPDGRELLLDAAHNPEGAAVLARHLTACGGKRPLVFGVMRDKDARAMLEALAGAVSSLVMTRARADRSAEPHALAALAGDVAPGVPVAIEPLPRDALARAWRLSPRIAVAGSIFLLGEVFEALSL
jgi:dihydrofolate synthase/folylpolyglutamate synthase